MKNYNNAIHHKNHLDRVFGSIFFFLLLLYVEFNYECVAVVCVKRKMNNLLFNYN